MSYAETKLRCGGSLLKFRLPSGTHLNLRYLTYQEFKIFWSLYQTESTPPSYIDELVALTIVQDDFFTKVWIDEQPAGICTTVAELIMFLSGDQRDGDLDILNQMIEASRAETNVLDNTLYSIICRVYPAYQFSDLDKLPFPEILRVYACAEKILLETGMISEPVVFKQNTGPEAIGEQSEAPPGTLVISHDEIRQSQRDAGSESTPSMMHDLEVEKLRMAQQYQKAQAAAKEATSYNDREEPKKRNLARSARKQKRK